MTSQEKQQLENKLRTMYSQLTKSDTDTSQLPRHYSGDYTWGKQMGTKSTFAPFTLVQVTAAQPANRKFKNHYNQHGIVIGRCARYMVATLFMVLFEDGDISPYRIDGLKSLEFNVATEDLRKIIEREFPEYRPIDTHNILYINYSRGMYLSFNKKSVLLRYMSTMGSTGMAHDDIKLPIDKVDKIKNKLASVCNINTVDESTAKNFMQILAVRGCTQAPSRQANIYGNNIVIHAGKSGYINSLINNAGGWSHVLQHKNLNSKSDSKLEFIFIKNSTGRVAVYCGYGEGTLPVYDAPTVGPTKSYSDLFGVEESSVKILIDALEDIKIEDYGYNDKIYKTSQCIVHQPQSAARVLVQLSKGKVYDSPFENFEEQG